VSLTLWWIAVPVGAAVLLTIVYALYLGIGPLPTSRKVRAALRRLLPSGVRRVVELGCGFGSLLPVLARHYPKGTIKAYELSPVPWLIAWIRSRLVRTDVHVFRQCLFRSGLEESELVVCYLYHAAMRRLATKLQAELKPGSYVLTHTFALPGWTPIETAVANDLYRTRIYLYQTQGGQQQLSRIRSILPQVASTLTSKNILVLP
jgi:hypothetical protein